VNLHGLARLQFRPIAARHLMLLGVKGVILALMYGWLATGVALAAATADFYVATNGNDSWSGTLALPNPTHTDGPFATIGKAQQAVRAILVHPGGRTNPIVVMIRKGTYYQSTPLRFGQSDSGTSTLQVIWQNRPGESPVISGGQRITGWSNVSDNRWQATLPASTQYFEQLFYNGSRRLRPRLGSSTGNNQGTFFRVASPVYLNSPGPPSQAPDPNCSFYVSGSGWECTDRFQYNPADPISRTWQNLAPPSGNACGQGAGNANQVGDIELVDFEFYTVPKMRISCIDATSNIVYLTGPTAQPLSITTNNHGFFAQHRYIIENIQDELVAPGQWFLDRSTNPWTLTYLANSGENPASDTVIVPQAPQVLVGAHLSYVTFSGLAFAHDNFVVPMVGYPSTQQDPAITSAVSFQNSSHITFQSNIVSQTSGGGLEFISCLNGMSPAWCVSNSLSAQTTHNNITNGAFYDIGAMAIRIGVPNIKFDTDANVPQFSVVQNNVIEGYGRVFPSAFGIVQGDAHDNTYSHNDIYDGYHSAVSICLDGCSPGQSNSHGAFNNLTSFNHVYNVMQGIMDDGGAIYYNTGSTTFTATGNQILNNRIHDIVDASVQDADGYGGDGIYLDQYTGNVQVENNLVYRVTAMGQQITCGTQLPNTPNTIKNNIFAFFQGAMLLEGCSPPSSAVQQFSFSNNVIYYGNYSGLQRGCNYCAGGNCPAVQAYSHNLYCDGTSGCSLPATPFLKSDASCTTTTRLSLSDWQGLGEDAGSLVADPRFVGPSYPSDNFALQGSSPVTSIGFVPFDMTAAGRSNPVIVVPPVAPAFPTVPMSTQTTIAIKTSLNPSSFGQATTFTVSLWSDIGPPPDGDQVTFTQDGVVVATPAITGGAASYKTSGLKAGNHSIVASYAGHGMWSPVQSNTVTQNVHKASSSTSVASSTNPSSYGQGVTFTATVSASGGKPTGSVTFKAGGDVIGSSPTVNGIATLTATTLVAGTTSVIAQYPSTSNTSGSTSDTLSQVVNPAGGTATIASSLNPSTYGQPITFTATVMGPSGPATGSVTFWAGTKWLGSSALDANGIATLGVSTLGGGTQSIVADYRGSPNVDATKSSPLSQVVNPASTTATATSSLNPSIYGQELTFSAKVTSTGGTPTGTVAFKLGGAVLGSSMLSSGTAIFSTHSPSAGTKSLVAVYDGQANFLGSSSVPQDQVVHQATTSTRVSASQGTINSGASVTLSATLTSKPDSASGTVSFTDGGTTLGHASINGHTATYRTSRITGSGVHVITATYAGSTNFAGSSATVNVTVK
jgi:hypothetical protein